MRVLFFLLEKEFKQIFRNKAMLPIMFVMPVIQLLILSFAVDFEIKNLSLTIVDYDKSSTSRAIVEKFTSSGYFELYGVYDQPQEAENQMHLWKTDLILQFPEKFEQRLEKGEKTELLLKIDALDGAKAGLGASYSQQIIGSFMKEFSMKNAISMNVVPSNQVKSQITPLFYFNPVMNYKLYMIPGLLVVLVTMIGAFLSSMNIVREKELGTIEQINVTPVKKYQFILSKTIPFWIIGLFEFTIGLAVGILVFDIHVVGNPLVMYSFGAIYLVLVLGFGLFISTITQTQQQAMFISWFFLVIFMLMGGIFTPVENMPDWAQKVTYFNPIRYFVEVTRSVILKGSGFADLSFQFRNITIFAFVMMGLAIWKYRKTI